MDSELRDASPLVVTDHLGDHKPKEALAEAGIEDAVTFVGRDARFQIWNPGDHKSYVVEARERAKVGTMRFLPPEGRDQCVPVCTVTRTRLGIFP